MELIVSFDSGIFISQHTQRALPALRLGGLSVSWVRGLRPPTPPVSADHFAPFGRIMIDGSGNPQEAASWSGTTVSSIGRMDCGWCA